MKLFKPPAQSIFLVLLSFIFLINCGRNEELHPGPIELACGTDQEDSVSTLTATIDGELFCPSSVVVYNRNSGTVNEVYVLRANIGIEDGENVGEYTTRFGLDIYIGPGTETGSFTASDNEIVAGVMKFHNPTNDYVYSYQCSAKDAGKSSGTVIIEEFTDGFIKGTFEFEMVADEILGELDGKGPNIFIKDGKFNIRVKE